MHQMGVFDEARNDAVRVADDRSGIVPVRPVFEHYSRKNSEERATSHPPPHWLATCTAITIESDGRTFQRRMGSCGNVTCGK